MKQKKRKKRETRMSEEYFRKIMLTYSQTCFDRRYHPRYVGKQLRVWQDAFEEYGEWA